MVHPFDNPYSEEQPMAPTVWRSRLWATSPSAPDLNRLPFEALASLPSETLLNLWQTGRISKKAYKRSLRAQGIVLGRERVGSEDLTNMA